MLAGLQLGEQEDFNVNLGVKYDQLRQAQSVHDEVCACIPRGQAEDRINHFCCIAPLPSLLLFTHTSYSPYFLPSACSPADRLFCHYLQRIQFKHQRSVGEAVYNVWQCCQGVCRDISRNRAGERSDW